MKLNQQFFDHLASGQNTAVFNKLIRSHRTSSFIIDCLAKETTEEAILEQMMAIYDAPRAQVAADIAAILESLREIGALDESAISKPLTVGQKN